LETFRCPTCVGVLPDAHVSRCRTCGQGLRRRHPRVLGEERRLATKQLPIDRFMLARLHAEPSRPRHTRRLVPIAWHGRFAPSPRSAKPDLVLPPVTEPPAPATIAPTTPADAEALAVAVPGTGHFEPETVEPVEPPVPVTPAVTPRPVVAHEELDPEVRALVDELFEQARAELAGFDGMFETMVDEPIVEAPIVEPPVVDSAPIDEASAEEPPATKNGGWVPAFVADERKRRTLND